MTLLRNKFSIHRGLNYVHSFTGMRSMNNVFMRKPFHSSTNLRKETVLYDFHKRNGGKFVDFYGYQLPIQYKKGIVANHCQTRESCGLFDVSHMLQLTFQGETAKEFLDYLVVGDILELKENETMYTLITNENGGIVDDCVVTNAGDHYYVVLNAGTILFNLIYIYLFYFSSSFSFSFHRS